MRAALTSFTDSAGISFFAIFSSIDAAMPATNGANCTVMLKNDVWRTSAWA